MALNAAIVWEVRTTGNANNGGGFKAGAAGTDYSQQDAAQYNYTDLVIDGTTNTKVTSASHNFVTADVGNIINITAGTGFTTGRYEIVSVASNAATLDRAVGTLGSTGGTFYVGGAVIKLSDITSAVVAGNTVWVKAGTYTDNVTLVTDVATVMTFYNGYNTTRGDNPTGTNRPKIEPSSGTCMAMSARKGMIVKNFVFSGSGGASTGWYSDSSSGGTITVVNCQARNCSGTGFNGGGGHYIQCEANNNGAGGFYTTISNGGMSGMHCYSHDNTGMGFGATNAQNVVFDFSIADSNTNHGFYPSYGSAGFVGCIAYNNTGASSDGFVNIGNINNYVSARQTINCISVNNGRYGFNGAGDNKLINYNCYNGNGTAGLNGITAGANDVTSSPSFTDAANGDFSFAAGSPCIDAGFPAHSMAGATV